VKNPKNPLAMEFLQDNEQLPFYGRHLSYIIEYLLHNLGYIGYDVSALHALWQLLAIGY
jgi:hypothetical protein